MTLKGYTLHIPQENQARLEPTFVFSRLVNALNTEKIIF